MLLPDHYFKRSVPAAWMLGFFLTFSSPAFAVDLIPLPEPVLQVVPKLELRGASRFKKYFFHVYDARLWTVDRSDWRIDQPYALDLSYEFDFAASALADRSVVEMEQIGEASAAERLKWRQEMLRAFPDVKAGDRLVGLYIPGEGTRFFLNGELYSEVSDPAFAEDFFGIWLDPRTSEPDLRRDLLAQQ
ncbi:MAG: chalcone isomerase family protein [Pseudomonadota bacterium]|nr:chalcone isomerase family protein [Pseudomonadota bacterium]